MTSIEYSIVIPTRYGSSRFPGKPLFELNGRAMILHVIDRARESSASQIVVATDDDRIAKVCADVGAQVQMTDPNHVSGTDRIAEVAGVLGWSDETIIVGLQGDEPATAASLLDRLAA
jgi:3-deoxy-manno-octulosonate cytidylyltransferase (CMP-KDO synthetase)